MELEKLQFGVGCKSSSELSADIAIVLPELIFFYLGLQTVQNIPGCSTDMAKMLSDSHPSRLYALLHPHLFWFCLGGRGAPMSF